MQHYACTKLGAGNQHKVFPFLSKMLTLPLFFQKALFVMGSLEN